MVSIDSMIIDPATFKMVPEYKYTLIGSDVVLNCEDADWKGQQVTVSYRVLSIDLKSPSFFIDTSRLEQREQAVYIGYDYNPYVDQNANPLFGSSNLNYSGSLSRGFSVGNSQSLVLNSNLNLQLNGDLGNGIRVVAAISDDNIPIQAEGNTQVLQEFDKVFIKVSKDQTDIIAGDYDLQSQAL